MGRIGAGCSKSHLFFMLLPPRFPAEAAKGQLPMEKRGAPRYGFCLSGCAWRYGGKLLAVTVSRY